MVVVYIIKPSAREEIVKASKLGNSISAIMGIVIECFTDIIPSAREYRFLAPLFVSLVFTCGYILAILVAIVVCKADVLNDPFIGKFKNVGVVEILKCK
jgi:hypothetical protein